MSLLSYENAGIEALSVHWVGNRSLGEPIVLSKFPQVLNDEKVHDRLLKFFLNNFKDRLTFCFDSAEINPLSLICSQVFKNPELLYEKSLEVAGHLYNVATHHWIKNGECWVVFFRNISCQGKSSDAFGIFKTELKEEFLTVKKENQGFHVSLLEGFNIKKIDKGCLVFDRSPEKGFEIMIIDNINIQDPAEYWTDKFLQVKPVKSSYYNTSNELKVLKAFLEEPDTTFDSLDKMDRINNSVNYMKENEKFNIDDFEANLFPEKEIRNSFDRFRKQYKDEYDVEIEDEYDIEAQVVKNQKKFIRSVIKLDRDFHIYIHGNRANIMRGYDEDKGMNFYKIYFSEES